MSVSTASAPVALAKSFDPSGRREARRFEALVAAHRGQLVRYARFLTGDATLAEDLAQETLVRAWRCFDSLREVGAVRGWLWTILRREHARYLAGRKPQVSIDDVTLPPVDDDPAAAIERAELLAAIAQLSPTYREPLWRFALTGCSLAETAVALNISVDAVKTRLSRARAILRERLAPMATGATA